MIHTDDPTSTDQIIEQVEQIRRLRQHYLISMIAVPVIAVVSFVFGHFIHPAFTLLLTLPVASIRGYSKILGFVKCPKCGDFYNSNPCGPRRFRWAWDIFESCSRCINCGFPI
jgi:hypothetical protein